MTDETVSAKKVSPVGGTDNSGIRSVYATAPYAAENDTVILSNVKEILVAQVMIDDGATKTVNSFTITDADNKLNLTGATTGTAHIFAIVR